MSNDTGDRRRDGEYAQSTTAVTATLIKKPYSDPPFAATLIKASVSVNVLFANYIEVNQVKM